MSQSINASIWSKNIIHIFADLEPESEDVRKLKLLSVEEMWGEERQEAGEEVEEAPDW